MCQTSPRTQKFKEMVFLLSNFEPTSKTDTRMKIIVVIKMIALTQWANNGYQLLCAYYVLKIILSTLHDFHLIPHLCPVIEVLISSSFYREEKRVIERLSNLPNVILLTSRKSEIQTMPVFYTGSTNYLPRQPYTSHDGGCQGQWKKSERPLNAF